MEQYRTDAEIYAVLKREIIDLTIRPGSLLSENPLWWFCRNCRKTGW